MLQTLPSLLQNYAVDLKGDLLASALAVCSSLQSVKNPAVSSSAVATLQQLVTSVFDKVADEDGQSQSDTHAIVSNAMRRASPRGPHHDEGAWRQR